MRRRLEAIARRNKICKDEKMVKEMKHTNLQNRRTNDRVLDLGSSEFVVRRSESSGQLCQSK